MLIYFKFLDMGKSKIFREELYFYYDKLFLLEKKIILGDQNLYEILDEVLDYYNDLKELRKTFKFFIFENFVDKFLGYNLVKTLEKFLNSILVEISEELMLKEDRKKLEKKWK